MRKSDESDTTGLCAISSEVKQVAGYLLTFFIMVILESAYLFSHERAE